MGRAHQTAAQEVRSALEQQVLRRQVPEPLDHRLQPAPVPVLVQESVLEALVPESVLEALVPVQGQPRSRKPRGLADAGLAEVEWALAVGLR